MASDVKVIIDLQKASGKLGFSMPLILKINEINEKSYAECSSLEAVVAAGFTTETDVYKLANMIFMQNEAPSKIAVCAAKTTTVEEAITKMGLISKGWRQLIVLGHTDQETLVAASAFIESQVGKMLFVDEGEDISAFTSKDRTFVVKGDGNGLAAAAIVGATAGCEPGSFTYHNMIVKGVSPFELTDTELEGIIEGGGNAIVTKAGDIVVTGGIVTSKEYADIIDTEDYIIQQLQYETQKVLNSNAKVPFDDKGIALLEAVAVNVMKTAYNMGMIATDENGNPAYTVSYAKKETLESGDIASRKYVGGSFSFTLAGAIHEAEIRGEIII